MNVLNISSSHPFKSAGILPYDFHQSLKKEGVNSKLLVLPYDKYHDADIINFRKNRLERKLERIIEKFSRTSTESSYDPNFYFRGRDLTKSKYTTTRIIKRIGFFNPDAIIIHFNKGFISAQNINELYEYYNIPIYWYLMDTTPMTGGCAYAWSCDGYQNNCGNCPAIFSENPFDISYKNLAYKIKYLEKVDLRLIVGSKGLEQQVNKSSLFKNKKQYKFLVPVDGEKFRPIDGEEKLSILSKYNLPLGKRMLFFGAAKIGQKRKGIKILLEAIRKLHQDNKDIRHIHFIIAGNLNEEITAFLVENNISYTGLGFLRHDELAEIFGVSDCFICPSIEDAGPMMVNQAIMSGCVVVGFPIGVCLDLIIDDITGFMAKTISDESLNFCLDKMISLDQSKIELMKENCRNLGLKYFRESKGFSFLNL